MLRKTDVPYPPCQSWNLRWPSWPLIGQANFPMDFETIPTASHVWYFLFFNLLSLYKQFNINMSLKKGKGP